MISQLEDDLDSSAPIASIFHFYIELFPMAHRDQLLRDALSTPKGIRAKLEENGWKKGELIPLDARIAILEIWIYDAWEEFVIPGQRWR